MKTHAPARRMLASAAAFVAIAAFASGAQADAAVASEEESEATPAEQWRAVLQRRAKLRRTLAYIGAGVMLGAYAGGLAFSAVDGFDNGKKAMWIPFAGPWLTLARRHHRCDEVVGGEGMCWQGFLDVGTIFILAADGVLQFAGAALLVTAPLLPDPKYRPAALTFVPYARAGEGGLVLTGAF